MVVSGERVIEFITDLPKSLKDMAERVIQGSTLETYRSSEDKEAIYKTLSSPIEVQVEITTACNQESYRE